MKDSMYLSPPDIPKGKSGKWSIEHDIIPAFTPIQEISHRTALFRGIQPKKTVCDFDLKIHILKCNGGIVMSDSLQERFDHEAVVDTITGKVLIGGLGLGYISSLLDRKRDVTEITIVEKSEDVIKLVSPYLHLKKLKQLYHQDLYKFLKNNKENYDYIYIDIWNGTCEATFIEHVLPLRKLCKPFVPSSKHIICWQEDVMRGQIKFALQNRLWFPPMFKELTEMPQQKFDKIFNNKFLLIQKPFWNWIRTLKISPPVALEAVNKYVDSYGESEFEEIWKEWM